MTRANVLHRTLEEVVYYKPHPPRKSSSLYRKTHHHLIYELDGPCWICGIRHSQGGAMETHHSRFEWASQFGLDLARVEADFPEITDRTKLAEWVDSEANMLVLCSAHHRSAFTGIHSVDYPVWVLQRYQGKDWTFIKQDIEQHGEPRAHTPLFS